MDERYIEAAAAFEESQREESIKRIRSAKAQFPPVGKCYNCGESVEGLRIYCDDECAEEHEWLLSRVKQNGNRL